MSTTFDTDELVKLMFSKNTSKLREMIEKNSNIKKYGSDSILYTAMVLGYPEIVDVLLENGFRGGKNEKEIFNRIFSENDAELFEVFLKHDYILPADEVLEKITEVADYDDVEEMVELFKRYVIEKKLGSSYVEKLEKIEQM